MRVKSLEAFYIQLSQISTYLLRQKFCDSAIWHFCTYLLSLRPLLAEAILNNESYFRGQ